MTFFRHRVTHRQKLRSTVYRNAELLKFLNWLFEPWISRCTSNYSVFERTPDMATAGKRRVPVVFYLATPRSWNLFRLMPYSLPTFSTLPSYCCCQMSNFSSSNSGTHRSVTGLNDRFTGVSERVPTDVTGSEWQAESENNFAPNKIFEHSLQSPGFVRWVISRQRLLVYGPIIEGQNNQL
jgi:hypothetical protein